MHDKWRCAVGKERASRHAMASRPRFVALASWARLSLNLRSVVFCVSMTA